jgi:deoxyribose-phosphate aldolase
LNIGVRSENMALPANMAPRTAAELARYIDHTLLAAEATRDEVLMACRDAVVWNVAAVCISPSWLPLPSGTLVPSVALCTVVGFPSGAHAATMKAREAALAVESGADEVDMVVNLGLVRDGRWIDIEAEVSGVRSALDAIRREAVLKVICESAALSDHELRATCKAAVAGGADFVKTSTGFHKAGGATERAVAIMRETVGPSIGVKASGGVRTTAAALSMIVAGATRIGTSATREILAGMPS